MGSVVTVWSLEYHWTGDAPAGRPSPTSTCSQPHSEKIRFPDGGATLMVQSHGVPELVPRAYDHTRGDPRPPVADLGPPGGWLAVQGAGQAAVARPARHLAVEMRRSAPAAGWPCPGGRSTTRQTADSVC